MFTSVGRGRRRRGGPRRKGRDGPRGEPQSGPDRPAVAAQGPVAAGVAGQRHGGREVHLRLCPQTSGGGEEASRGKTHFETQRVLLTRGQPGDNTVLCFVFAMGQLPPR